MLYQHSPMRPAARSAMTLAALLAAALPIAGYGSTTMRAVTSSVEPPVARPLGDIAGGSDAARAVAASAPAWPAGPGLPSGADAAGAYTEAGAGPIGSALLTGAVRDPMGRFLPGVHLTLRASSDGLVREVTTDWTGLFQYSGLPAEAYELRASAPGFTHLVWTFTLNDGQAVDRSLRLSPADVVESFSVPAIGSTPGGLQPFRPDPTATVQCLDGRRYCVTPARRIAGVHPVHPGVAGLAIVEATMARDGRITGARVLRTPHPDLATVTLDAVREWMYEPTLLHGVAVPGIVVVTARFE